jgi:heme a synthase
MLNKWVKYWLFIGLVMIFIQVIVGGITRLTESGLSITKWEIISGTFPPLTSEAWEKEFDLYKGTPQYKEINEGMSISDFKFIYFWEYIHRLWARWMGFVFLIPFLIFYRKKLFDNQDLKNLGIVILLAMLAASFGFIMVASGLIERPWVNAYKLSLHLCIAFSVYAYLFYTYLSYAHKDKKLSMGLENKNFDKIMTSFLVLLWIQLFFGGVMSGMKAGIYFPTWPDINGEYIPQVIFDISQYNVDNFNKYESNMLLPSLTHFLHRTTAYLLLILGLVIVFMLYKTDFGKRYRTESNYFLAMLIIQVILGIITVLMCKGEVPILWGVLHQAGALLLLTATMWFRFKIKRD